MQEKYGVELKLLTEKFKTRLKETASSVKTWAKGLKKQATVNAEVKFSDKQLEEAYNKVKKLNNKKSFTAVADFDFAQKRYEEFNKTLNDIKESYIKAKENKEKLFGEYNDLIKQRDEMQKHLNEMIELSDKTGKGIPVKDYWGAVKEIDRLNDAIKEMEPNLKSANTEFKKMQSKIDEVSAKQERANYNFEKAKINIIAISKETNKIDFRQSEKNLKKFLLSLFSIRSVWSFISRASSTYLSENERVNQSVRLTASIFGNILAPVIKKVIDIAQYGAIVIAKIIQLFTGYNALAGVTANAMKGVTKAGKEMNKSLASFDTISNLGDDASGIASGIADSVKALDDFQEKVAKVEEIFRKYEGYIKAATIALGLMFGASILSKIASVIGIAGAGATAQGASGLLGVLSIVALLSAIDVITITIAVKGVKKVVEEYKSLNSMLKNSEELTKGLNDATEEQAKKFEELILSGGQTNDVLERYAEWLVVVVNNNNEENDKLEKQKTILGILTGEWGTLTKRQRLNNDETVNMINRLIKLNEYLEKENEKLDKNSDEYKENEKLIKQVREQIEQLTSRNYDTTVKLNLDTADAQRSYDNFVSRLGHTLGTILDPSSWGSGWSEKVKKAWKGSSYAVGTNYVPNDQLAMVHKGEMIIPAKYNPMTSNINSSNDETNSLLRTLITTLENKDMNAYISAREIGQTATNYINSETRISGRSVLK